MKPSHSTTKFLFSLALIIGFFNNSVFTQDVEDPDPLRFEEEINRGFGGSHFSDLLYYYDSLVLPYIPSVLVLYEGDNDVASGKSNDQVYKDYLEFTDRLTSDFPDVKLVFVPIKPSNSRWDKWPQMKRANERIKDHIDQNDNFYYVDMATPLLGSDGTPDDSLFLDDQLHLNDRGYTKWNEAIRPVLERLMEE